MIEVKIDARRVKKAMDKMVLKIPVEQDNMGLYIAKQIKKSARIREAMKERKEYSHKGLLKRMIDYAKLTKSKRTVTYVVVSGAPYSYVQERGLKGWHFIPAKGTGKWGEGYAKLGGVIPSRYPEGKKFMEGAYASVNRRLNKIMKRFGDRMVRA